MQPAKHLSDRLRDQQIRLPVARGRRLINYDKILSIKVINQPGGRIDRQ